MNGEHAPALFLCQCRQCREQPNQRTAELHAQIIEMAALLNEKHRRQFAGLIAWQWGHGGIQQMAEITGLGRNTIARGQQEIEAADFGPRVRAPGAGRPLTEKKSLNC